MRIPPLYHWSPVERRKEIRSEGIKPYSMPTVMSDPKLHSPYTCFSSTPSQAWGLSGDFTIGRDGGVFEQWDLWQINLAENDEVHIRPEFGPTIQEFKVYTVIPADRVWWVGVRETQTFEEVGNG